MSESEPTLSDLESDISLHWRRVKESREDKDTVLEKTFIGRMNRSLDEYGDVLKWAGNAAVVLFERRGGRNILPSEMVDN